MVSCPDVSTAGFDASERCINACADSYPPAEYPGSDACPEGYVSHPNYTSFWDYTGDLRHH